MTSERISRRRFVQCAAALGAIPRLPQPGRPPNVIVVFADDLGYADLACFGGRIPTPHIDGMAAQGMRFTSFYAAQAVCSASRAALLTGCYPNRIGILGALGPKSQHGISGREMTLAELVKQRGYATAIFGKWHLGHHTKFLPTRHGFDEYLGLPYSNDMWPRHPTDAKSYPPLPLIEGEKVIRMDPDQTQLTTMYTDRAISFIERHRRTPFLLYLAHSMPHVPLHVSARFAGKSGFGLYGDVIQEIDGSVGRILETVRKHGLDERTLFVFTSDNGPWLSYGDHSGSAGVLREGKGTTWEGGVRVPCVMRWPGFIPGGSTCREPAMTIDILPTVAALTGASLPAHRVDGLDIGPLMRDERAASPHDALFFYWEEHLQAVRSGRWKLHFPHEFRTLAGRAGGAGGRPTVYENTRTGRALFDLEKDVGEKTDVAPQHPEISERLESLAERAREDLGDSASGRKGRGVRAPGRLDSR
jgi:arylsulfatase A-like enzyme